MRRFLVAVAAFACAAVAAAQQPPVRIEPGEFTKLHAGGRVLVVDVRSEGEFRAGHIPGAVNVPLGQESRHVDRLRAAKRPIVTYCA